MWNITLLRGNRWCLELWNVFFCVIGCSHNTLVAPCQNVYSHMNLFHTFTSDSVYEFEYPYGVTPSHSLSQTRGRLFRDPGVDRLAASCWTTNGEPMVEDQPASTLINLHELHQGDLPTSPDFCYFFFWTLLIRVAIYYHKPTIDLPLHVEQTCHGF